MAIYIGWDIGGVHLKLSRLECAGRGAASLRTRVAPFEIWKDPGGLARRLRELLEEARGATGDRRDGVGVASPAAIAAHGVTMTAELSDAFPTKAQGVRAVLAACSEALLPAPLRILDVRGDFIGIERAREEPLAVAAANWAATARLASRKRADAILIDVGSTTTDIIPIRGGGPRPRGRSDTDRLLAGELVYSGLLRTPPAALTEAVPLRGGWCRVSCEHFAISADAYRVLGRIGEADYTVPTPDGRGKGREESAARLARVVCSDPAALAPEEIAAIASYLEERQIDRIARALGEVMSRDPATSQEAVVAGAGAFLAEAAAGRAGLRSVRLSRLLPGVAGEAWDVAAPSAAIAILLAEASGEIGLAAADGPDDPEGAR
jgi:probable H4MPT-linked C1 transfer pathway protein